MKKRFTIASLILVLALVLTSVFVLLASAEPTTEATLTVGSETVSGTYDEMVEALNEKGATLGESTATLTLTANAVASKQLVLTGTGVESVYVDLGGYSLEISALDGDAFVASGLASFDLNGGYNSYATVGKILGGSAYGIASITNVATAEIYDVDMSHAASTSAITVSGSGETILRNVYLENRRATDGHPVLVSAESADITFINSDIIDAKTAGSNSIGILANSSTVRLENTAIKADIAYSNGGGSELTALDAKLEGKTAIFGGEPLADDVIRCLGVSLKGNILGGSTTKDMVQLYYGTGSTVIDAAEEPSASFTLATTVAEVSELSAGKWTLKPTASGEVIYAQAFDRGEVTEQAGIYSDAAALSRAVSETKNVVTIAFIANEEFNTSSINLFGDSSNGKTSTFVDYNGFTATQTKDSHFQSAKGLFRLSLDGSDAAGNVGGVTNTAYRNGAIYVNNSDINSVVTLKDIRITNTNGCGSTSGTNMIHLQSARYYFNNIHVLYTGAEFGRGVEDGNYYYKDSYVSPMVLLQLHAFLTAENCRFEAAPTGAILNEDISLENIVFSLQASSSSVNTGKAFASNCEFVGVGTVAATGKNEEHKAIIANSVVIANTTPFRGDATTYPVIVTDCDITLPEGVDLASGKVEFSAGEGKTRVHTKSTEITGSQVLPEGYTFIYSSDKEAFVLLGGDAVTTVKMNKLFANGMVFQAGKPINVWGSCSTDGAEIKVTLGDKSTSTTVKDGEWFATLDAMDYAKGLTLTVTEVGKEFGNTVFNNVDIGEVWITSGQSNSNLGAYNMEDFEEYLALADNYDNIRCFSVANAMSETPLWDFRTAEWYQVNSQTLPKAHGTDSNNGISAIAYVMATRLAVELDGNVTIAVVDINYKGKAISHFISNDYDPKANKAEDEHQIYNGMIAPMKGYNVKGIGWYQGEATWDASKCNLETDDYYGLNVDQLYATFTDTCNVGSGEPLELFIVQLSAYMSNPVAFRAYQADIAARNEHYHLIGASWAGSSLSKIDFALDDGDGFDNGHVHAARKSPIGLAWADSILENVYFKDQNLSIANPEIESTVVEGSAIKVTLDRDFALFYGSEVIGFELSADGTNWYLATGTVDGRTITLTSPGLAAPKYVRYGWGYSQLELESGEFITFSSDTKSGVTYESDNENNKNVTTVTITTDNATYVINVSDPEVIRSMLPGNIVAINGHTLGVFCTSVISSTAGEN